MSKGISGKLTRTYLVIIAITIVSGAFYMYVLGVNIRTNADMRFVMLPSLEKIKEQRSQMQEIKKLVNTWVYASNNRDRSRLMEILHQEHPSLVTSIDSVANLWSDKEERSKLDSIKTVNRAATDSAIKVTQLLATPEDYVDDSLADIADHIAIKISNNIESNDTLYERLLQLKETNLEKKQNIESILLNSLYAVVVAAVLLVILVAYWSLRYTRRNIVQPLLQVNKYITDLGQGEVVEIGHINTRDEIGEMYKAMQQMVDGIIQKINFAEQIGRGSYDAHFQLLSDKDRLGIALKTMKNDLATSTEALMEQDRRLLDAQKMARLGNYFYNIETSEFQTSATLDDILGIDGDFRKKHVNWQDYMQPESHAEIAQKAVDAIKQHDKFRGTYRVKRFNDGALIWVKVIGEYNYNAEGRAISMFGTMQDVTESKQLEIDLNSSYKVAREQNNRLLNFSYIVSHNLRMHTVNIHSLLNLIDECESDEERKEYLAYLRTSSDQLEETLQQLNEVVAMRNAGNLQLSPIQLHNAIAHTIQLLTTNITGKQGSVINNVAPDLTVNYNPVYMDSILLNFISNAIKYSHPDRPPVVNINCYKENTDDPNSRWVLEFADNGQGIDLERHGNKLFGMYKTFHGNKDAKGIGLFMTRYQVEAMDGDITVESTVNKGTTFRVFIK